MVKAPEKKEEPGKPLIFLLFAAIFVAGAIVGYVYEDELFLMRPYRDITAHSVNVYFLIILMVSLIGAFFSLFCFLNPNFGNRVLGRGGPKLKEPKEATVTYNVFADTTPSSVKAMHRRRKMARHDRHKYAKATRENKPKKKS